MKETMDKVKQTTTNYTKGLSSSKEGAILYMVKLEENLQL